jgi:hypothetical protein
MVGVTSPRPLALLRKALTRQPSATTVTVTHVTGSDAEGEAVPDTVVVTTAEPVRDTASHRLARWAMVVASVALATTVLGIATRTLLREVHYAARGSDSP